MISEEAKRRAKNYMALKDVQDEKTIEKAAVIRSNLRFCLMEAVLGCNENRHPQVVMKELGITYQHATPQSMGDQWWFWNCENLPEKMPSYLTPLNLNPIHINTIK